MLEGNIDNPVKEPLEASPAAAPSLHHSGLSQHSQVASPPSQDSVSSEESLDTVDLLSILSSAFDAQSSDEGSNFGNNLQPNDNVTIKTEPMAQVPSLGIKTSTYFSNLGTFVFISLLNRHNCDSLSCQYSWK